MKSTYLFIALILVFLSSTSANNTYCCDNDNENSLSDIDTENHTEQKRSRLTDFADMPKFGGYVIGKYSYDDREDKNSGDGFTQRLIRLYVDGTILNDFAYRVQIQANNNSFHMKDYYIEWKKYPEFKLRFGQYKRAFGFENPMNPWDVGDGDYSQLTKYLTGHSDFIEAESKSNGGRDQGIQVQGDLFPVSKDGHRLLRYQLMVANGQGINVRDEDSRKDILGSLQIQPIQGLYLGFFGWTGSFTSNEITVNRNRYILGTAFDRNGWTFRGEYAHSTGHKISDWNGTSFTGNARADAIYATLGIPCTKTLKMYLKYDSYRADATSSTRHDIYTLCANIRLHKNLLFQLQYNFNHDNALSVDKSYNQLWAEAYVRF